MKVAIIANGNFLPAKMIQEISQDSIIIALDGAAQRLIPLGIIPHYVLGDFDSIDTFFLSEHSSITAVYRPDQSYTDLHKALHFAKEHHATEIHILCALSETRLDHSFLNTRLLRVEASPDCTIQLHSHGQTLTYATNTTVTMRGEVGDACGILAFPEGAFHAQGLVWNGPYTLQFGHQESACNRMAATEARIVISGEALIIHPPWFLSQRLALVTK